MLKAILLAIWAAASTLGAFYILTHTSGDARDNKETARPLTEHRTESMAITVYKNGRVFGHFVTRVMFSIPDNRDPGQQPPVSLLIEDGLQDLVPRLKIKDLVDQEEATLRQLGQRLVDMLNSRNPDLLIEKLEFSNTKLSVKKSD